jgi:type III secretory pathway component EscS
MTDSLTYTGTGAPTRAQTHTLFAQTMGYVAVTAALFALGAWLGRNLARVTARECHRFARPPRCGIVRGITL